MATFANKASNLSALESKFDRLLKIRHPGKESHGYRSEEEKQKNAEFFFATQRNRTGKIEKELVAATGNILPPSKDSKTITELAELCRLTQLATREKLEALRSCLENEGYTVTSPRSNNLKEGYSAANNVSRSSPTLDRKSNRTKATGQINVFGLTYDDDAGETSLPLVTNIGGPLESVIEAEYETDGMTTPGSALESPFFSSAQRRRNISVTPSLSARKEKVKNRRKSSSFSLRSPVTPPALDKLRISDSTNELLHHATNDPNNINDINHGTELHSDTSFPEETPNKSLLQYQQPAENQEEQQHLFEFREEDDMITLDTTMTKNTTLCSPMMYGATSSEKRSFEEERSQFFARMEGILERVEETIMEDSQSPMSHNQDENDSMETEIHRESTQSFTSNNKDVDEQYERSMVSMRSNDAISTKSNRSEYKAFYEDESETMLADNDEYSGMNYSRDSTNMVATQVAGKDASKSDSRPFGMSENNAEDKNTYSVNPHRPTHILVDSGMASPAHTNITMDATFMSDVNESSLVRREERFDTRQRGHGFINKYMEEDDDNLSTVTPVLDRYRLDPSDGTSSGVKVVPNKRSAHRSNKKRTPTSKRGQLPTIAQLSPSLDHILHARTPKNEYNESDFISPRVGPSERHHQSINSNTPTEKVTKVYRKTPFRKRMPFDVEEDEDENHNPNISVGFSTPYSKEKASDHGHGTFSISVPPLRHSSIEPNRTDFPENHSRQAYLQEETDTIQKIDETIDRIDVELSSPRRTFDDRKSHNEAAKKAQIDSDFSFDKITIFEFESSPRIVRTSVSRNLANKALHAIHVYCSSSSTQIDGFKFTEREGCDILGLSGQETKNILISLCHWRRLLMKKDATHGMIFAVNNRKKEADKSFV